MIKPGRLFSFTNRGFVMLPVVITLLIVALLAFVMNRESGMNAVTAGAQTDMEQARLVAEAGLQHAIWSANNNACTGYALASTAFGAHDYSASISPTSGSPVTITATGVHASGTSRTLVKNGQLVYQAPSTVVMQPGAADGKDTLLDNFWPTRNFGGVGYVTINSNPSWKQVPVLEFDLSSIPATATVISATLELKQLSISSAGVAGVHRMTRSWVVGTRNGGGQADGATWNSYDSINPWTTAGGDYDATVYGNRPVSAADSGQFVSWDVSNLVADWVSAAVPNYGLALVGGNGIDNAQYTSSETNNPPDAPKLTVTWACECGQTCTTGPAPPDLLLVVVDPANLGTQELAKKALIEGWGYAVSLIDEADSQANYDAAIAANDVAYIPQGIDALVLAGKLNAAAIGVVNEEPDMVEMLDLGNKGETFTGSQVDVVENTHFITTGFAPGLTTIVTTAQPLAYNTGGFPQGAQSLATVYTGITWKESLYTVERGEELSTKDNFATGRRAQLPWGGSGFDVNALNTDGLTLMQRAIDWAAGAGTAGGPVQSVLLVVPDATSLGPQDTVKKSLIESWGFAVALISASAPQGEFDTAVAASDVAYVSEEIISGDLGTKLRDATIGVVIEEEKIHDAFGISSAETTSTEDSIDITDNTHYITALFSLGEIAFVASPQPVGGPNGTLAPGLSKLALQPSSSTGMLDVLETGGALFDSGTAAGRRVKLPWGGNDFDINSLTADGQTIMRRALKWAAAPPPPPIPIAHWMLDDGTGTTAIDSEGGHDGTLVNGPSWTVGQIGDALDFDGSDDYVDLTSDAGLDDVFVGGATVMAWIEPAGWGGSGYGRIFDKSSSASATGDGWAIRLNTDNGGLNFGQGFASSRGWWRIPNNAITLGSWQHIAVAYDASSTANVPVIYVNGNPVSVTQVDTPSGAVRSDAAINLRLGAHASASSQNVFDGKIDDARIYARILSAADIAGFAGAGGGGVIYQEFTEASLASNGTSLTVDKPAGTAAGDLLIAAVATDGSTKGSLAAPAGWTIIDVDDRSGAVTFGVWWKLAGASEPANYTFSWSGSEQAYGMVMRFTGHDATAPINVSASSGNTSATPTSPAVTTTVANALVLRLAGFDDDDITLDSTGLSAHTDISMDASSTGNFTTSAGAGFVLQPVAGDSGTANFALTASEEYRAVTIGIAP